MRNKILIMFGVAVLACAQPAFSAAKDKTAQEATVQFDDMVFRMEESEGGKRVMFKTHAAVYHLRQGMKGYQEALKLLEASRAGKEKVKVRADADSMEIREVSALKK